MLCNNCIQLNSCTPEAEQSLSRVLQDVFMQEDKCPAALLHTHTKSENNKSNVERSLLTTFTRTRTAPSCLTYRLVMAASRAVKTSVDWDHYSNLHWELNSKRPTRDVTLILHRLSDVKHWIIWIQPQQRSLTIGTKCCTSTLEKETNHLLGGSNRREARCFQKHQKKKKKKMEMSQQISLLLKKKTPALILQIREVPSQLRGIFQLKRQKNNYSVWDLFLDCQDVSSQIQRILWLGSEVPTCSLCCPSRQREATWPPLHWSSGTTDWSAMNVVDKIQLTFQNTFYRLRAERIPKIFQGFWGNFHFWCQQPDYLLA